MGQRNRILFSLRGTSAAHWRRVGQGETVGKQEMWAMKTPQNYCKLPPLKIEKSNIPLPKVLRVASITHLASMGEALSILLYIIHRYVENCIIVK